MILHNTDNITDERAAELFLEWFNDFLSIESFARYHGFKTSDTIKLLERGKDIHNFNQL